MPLVSVLHEVESNVLKFSTSLTMDPAGHNGRHIVVGEHVFTRLTQKSLSVLPPEQYTTPDDMDSINTVQDHKWIHHSMPFMLLVPKYDSFHGSILDRLDYRDGRFPVEFRTHDRSWSLDPHIITKSSSPSFYSSMPKAPV